MVMTALDASMVTAMFAFVWIKLSRYGRQEDWEPWFEQGEPQVPFCPPRVAFFVVWLLLDVAMALSGFFVFGDVSGYAVSGCDNGAYIAAFVLFFLTVLACKMYTVAFVDMGSRVGGLVTCLIAFGTAIGLTSVIGKITFMQSAPCPNNGGYGVAAFVLTLLYTVWLLFASYLQYMWVAKKLATRTQPAGDGPDNTEASVDIATRSAARTVDRSRLRESLLKTY
jgi:tryptophan-rich sensory protein